jgi:hypothetical protein
MVPIHLRARSWRLSVTTKALTFSFLLFALCATTASAIDWPGPQPGVSHGSVSNHELRLENHLIAAAWDTDHGSLRLVRVNTPAANRIIELSNSEVFRLVLADGAVISCSDLKLASAPSLETLRPELRASVLAERLPGQQLSAKLVSTDGKLQVTWRAMLRDGANAIRQEILFLAARTPVAVKEVQLLDLPPDNAEVVGTVSGSPVFVGDLFFAYEHPDAQIAITERVRACLSSAVVLAPDAPVLHSAAIGFAPQDQRRRAFLYYVERERAHPYRPFLHYNAWYDICWGNRKITERECLDVIDRFGRELIRDRGVPLASFVWDDGWDDPHTLWRPIQTNFPNGFSKVLFAARENHSTLGFWLSPFGGYGQAKEDRLAMGKAQGFETTAHGFSLAGPHYYGRFLDSCLGFIRVNGANFFKFDGLTRDVRETEAMLRLTHALRARKSDLFISITTGTWPSPFWLWYGDSTWRGGADMGFTGVGSKREQWITYRDRQTFRNIVRPAPLYPLNSLMTQGFAHARYGTALEVGSEPAEIRRELRSFFASGTCLQELYVTPEKMAPVNWDDLAECANWAHANADVLVDTHWIGGDPGKGEPYGWAAWSRRKGILALRNPSDQPQAFTVDPAAVFELPMDAPRIYTLESPWTSDAGQRGFDVRAGRTHRFDMRAFEVLIFEALPRPQ